MRGQSKKDVYLMRNLVRYTQSFLATGLGFFLAACGGGGNTSAPTAPPPTGPTVTAISVTPTTAVIGTQIQFVATVTGTGDFNTGVVWEVTPPAGSQLSPGTITKTGLFTTPYPAPATVTVTGTAFPVVAPCGTVALIW